VWRPPCAYHPILYIVLRRRAVPRHTPRTQDTNTRHAPRTHAPHANILYTVHGRFRKFVASSVVYGRFGFGHWQEVTWQGRRPAAGSHSGVRVHVAATATAISASPSPCPAARPVSSSFVGACVLNVSRSNTHDHVHVRLRVAQRSPAVGRVFVRAEKLSQLSSIGSFLRVRVPSPKPKTSQNQDTNTKPPNPTDVRKTVDCLACSLSLYHDPIPPQNLPPTPRADT
jgi:hypothetical protein